MNLIAIFPAGATELTVNGLHQWDYGRKLDIHATDLPAIVEVHFACPGMDEAIVRVGSAAGGVATVSIPDRCLEQSSPITAWVYEVGDTYGQTLKTLTLNITARTRPQTAETFDPETSDKYTEAVAAMNEAIETLQNGDIKAKEADHATEADHASTADSATTADSAATADHATTADSAATADHATTADSANEATKARRLRSLIINSYDELISVLEECGYYGTYAIAINEKEISLPNSAGTLPIWHSGIMVADTDVSLTLTGIDGDIVSVYYNKTNDVWKVKNLSGLSILGSNNKVTAPGLYAVTLKPPASVARVTHMISILDLNTSAYSSPDVTQSYAVFVPGTQIIAPSDEVTVSIEKVVCIAEYNF